MTLAQFVALLGVLLLAGCGTVRTDLSAPCERRELASPPVEVVRAGTALDIVAADTPETQWAALFLAQTIRETCGVRPAVYIERPDCPVTNRVALFVGAVTANRGWDCALSAKSGDAFRVVARDGCVRFLGRADYAVFDWCERELGMRFYCAGGKCVEPRQEIVAQAVDYSDRPVFEHRRIGGAESEPWARVGRSGSRHRGGTRVHAPHLWYTNEALKAERPGIFESGRTPMLCYGNPETLEYYKLRIDRQIAGLEDAGGIVDTDRKVVTVCQWDAPIDCRCRHCAPLYELTARGESASPIIWGRFLRKLSAWLAEAHPDYMVSFLPYWNTCEIPRSWKRAVRRSRGPGRHWRWTRLPGNAEAEICTMPGLALLKDEACRRREERIIRDWRKVTGRKVLNFHYGCWPQERTSAPYVFGETIRRHYAETADATAGSYVCGGADDPRLALSMYVWQRCLWNPEVDVEAIYDGFARRMFGPAERPMRELIALQESCWERPWDSDSCTWRNVFDVSFPREDVARMRALLKEACALADGAGDRRAKDRVVWYVSGFVTFLRESDALARRDGRKVVRPGETNEFVVARSAVHPRPWAGTKVVTDVRGNELCLRVACEEPAVARMDFADMVKDAVWGNDSVQFVIGEGDDVKRATVYLTGKVEKGWPGFSARVAHGPDGWTVEARIALTERQRSDGKVLGNICRWRVGDRRLPQAERVPDSRYEQSRLDTCYTFPNDDPAAFVEFRLRENCANPQLSANP